MIRQATNCDLDGRHEAVCLISPVSCFTLFVSPDRPDGVVTRPQGIASDVPWLSALSVLAFYHVPAESVDQFTTADSLSTGGSRHRSDNELQWLEETRGYLRCLAERVEPSTRLRGAWDQFFHVYNRRIRSAVQACDLSAADAEDCVQDVWMVILDVLKRSGHDPQWGWFSGWMRGLIHNQVIVFVRRLARRPDREAGLPAETIPGRELDPLAACQLRERRHLVRHVLTDLKQQVSAINYRLVHFRWLDGCEVKEVAARLDLTSEQVWYRQHRVKRRLRCLLKLHGEPSE